MSSTSDTRRPDRPRQGLPEFDSEALVMMDERASIGVVRQVDKLGRIVIRIEIRRRYGLEPGWPLSIFTDDDEAMIVLAPLASSCAFCGSAEDLEHFRGKPVCASCRAELGRRARSRL